VKNDVDYNGNVGLGVWDGYEAFNQVATSIKGNITAAKFLKAAEKATIHVPELPPIDFAKKSTILGPDFPNLIDQSISFQIYKDGNLTPFQSGNFFNMTAALLGKKLPKADTP
jgi:hypothetical protein